MNKIKLFIRKILQPLMLLGYQFIKEKKETDSDGRPFKKGISAVISMKNEDYTILLALKSLIGFADEIIVIDNGSTDQSLKLVQSFKTNYSQFVKVVIIEMPDALLGECRNAGLKASTYCWHLRWDADMVAYSNGSNDIKKLKEEIMKSSTPRTYQLSRLNLYGDLQHTMGDVREPGEPWLVWNTKDLNYREFGKFDALKIPYYYKQIIHTDDFIFHCSGTKSIDNLLHRFHYFTWREYYNYFNDVNRPEIINNFDKFKSARNLYLFDTNEEKLLHYRYNKQLTSQFRQISKADFNYMPQVIEEENKNENRRFKVIYVDNKPFFRVDNQDTTLKNWEEIKDDWNIQTFFEKIKQENHLLYK